MSEILKDSIIKKLTKIQTYRNLIEDNAFSDNLYVDDESIDNYVSASLEQIVERLEYMSTHKRGQYKPIRVAANDYEDAPPNLRDTTFLQDLGNNLKNTIEYLKSSKLLTTDLIPQDGSSRFVLRLENDEYNTLSLSNVIEISYSIKNGDTVSFTSEKHRLENIADGSHEMNMSMRNVPRENIEINFHFLYRDKIICSIPINNLITEIT